MAGNRAVIGDEGVVNELPESIANLVALLIDIVLASEYCFDAVVS